MTLLKNLGLSLLVFLPLVAVVSMVVAGVLGDRAPTAPEWRVGWNPILWLIMTAPWLLPTVLVVPLLHFLGRGLGKRFSVGLVRGLVVAASPILFLLAVLALWGPGNFDVGFVLPVFVSALVYGSVLRIRVTSDRVDSLPDGGRAAPVAASRSADVEPESRGGRFQ